MAEQSLAHEGVRTAIIGHAGLAHPVTCAELPNMTDALAHAKRFFVACSRPRELRMLAISEPESDTPSDERAKQ